MQRLRKAYSTKKASRDELARNLKMGYGGPCCVKDRRFYICLLCNQQIHPTEAYYLAHLIKSHGARIASFSAYGLSDKRKYHIVIEYPSDSSSHADEGYDAELWIPEKDYYTYQCNKCKSEIPFRPSDIDRSKARKDFFDSHKAEEFCSDSKHRLIIYYCNKNQASQ